MTQSAIAMPQGQLPTTIYQQAVNYQLGEFAGVYKPRFANPLLIIGMVIGVIILDIVLLVALVIFTDRISYYLVIVPIIAIVYGVYGLIHSGLRIYAFTNGFIHAKGSAITPVRWDQVQGVWQKITQSRSGMSYKYTVCRNDGQVVEFGSPLQNIGPFGMALQEQVANLHLPKAIAAYNAGQAVAFGPLNVDRQGINNGKQIVPWDQVGSIRLNQGAVTIEKDGRLLKWSSVKAADVPNLLVFIKLVEYIVKGQR